MATMDVLRVVLRRRVRQRSGSEPLGLAIACMIGGSRSVIGGVIEVEDETTAQIRTEVAAAVAAGAHPASALRRSQLAMLDHRAGTALVHEWAGLVCISTDLPDEQDWGPISRTAAAR
jgi:hypothetical protein